MPSHIAIFFSFITTIAAITASVVVGICENGTASLPRFYFSRFQKFLSVGFGVVKLHIRFAKLAVFLFQLCLCLLREEEERKGIVDQFLDGVLQFVDWFLFGVPRRTTKKEVLSLFLFITWCLS